MTDSIYRNIKPASEKQLSDGISLDTSEPPGRKKTSLACIACRRRRSKCDAGTPCVSCIQRNTECVKDEYDDGRRKLALRRKIEILENNCGLLDDLLAALRTFTSPNIDALLNVVRSNATRAEIYREIRRIQRGSEDSMQLDSPKHEPPRNRRRMLGRIEDMVNPPMTVPAKPWTTVTDDDDYVSHLMSLWFTWAHQWWHWVDSQLFLEEMRRGNLESKICTPYLVNMILADACLLDTLQNGETEPNPQIRGLFYEQGRQGIEKEGGRVSLALVSALGVQWTYLNTNGQDELGNAVLYQQVYHSKDLDKWRQKIARDTTARELEGIDRSLSRLEWTLFALNSFTSLNVDKTQTVKQPPRPKPPPDPHTDDQSLNWTAYPQQHGAYTFHENCLYLAFLSLAEVSNREEEFFTDKDPKKRNTDHDMQRFENMYSELKDWPNILPDCMRLSANAVPHVIALHALYGWAVVRLAKQTAALGHGDLRAARLTQTPHTQNTERLRGISTSMAINIGQLLDQIRTNWTADHFPVIIMQPLAIAVFPLLEVLHERNESQEALYNMILVARAASRRFRVAKGILTLLQQTAIQMEIQLPEHCQQLLSEDHDVDGSQPGVAYLLEKWDDLDLDEF